MKTIEQISELILINESILLLMSASEIQPFLTKATQHQFDDQATRYFFDKKNRELFKDQFPLSVALNEDVGLDVNLTKDQIAGYKKRRAKLCNSRVLFYDLPIDEDVIELNRLKAEEWSEIFLQLLSEVGSSSPYYEQLSNNYSKYIDGSFPKKYIRHAILEDIQDEVLITNFDYLISLKSTSIIIDFFWKNRLNDNKEDLFKGITVFGKSDVQVKLTNQDKFNAFMNDSKFSNEADSQLKPKVNNNKDDKLDGLGTYIYPSGETYVGELKNGLPNGQGTSTYSNGDKYVGDFKDGRRNGHGTMTFVNGDKHMGEYIDDLPNGHGTVVYVNDDKYEGNLKNAKLNGMGIYTYVNGDKYEGEFKDDEFHGQAKITRANGETFTCEYKNGERLKGK
jgi:hypothetical protein